LLDKNYPVTIRPHTDRREPDLKIVTRARFATLSAGGDAWHASCRSPLRKVVNDLEGARQLRARHHPRRLRPAVTRDELDFTLLDRKDLSPAFIRKRAKSGRTEDVPEPSASKPAQGEVIDLMELLKRSVERRGRASARKRRSAPRVRRTA
jgi:hypothetical protein